MSSLWLSIPLVIQLAIPTKGNAGQWNYDDRHRNELCFRGKRQSPIDLDIGTDVRCFVMAGFSCENRRNKEIVRRIVIVRTHSSAAKLDCALLVYSTTLPSIISSFRARCKEKLNSSGISPQSRRRASRVLDKQQEIHGTRGDYKNGKAIVMRWAPISFHHYDAHGFVTVVKDGQKELVEDFHSWTEKPYITGGGLRGKYYLQQFHFHWSGNDLTGSEHTIGRLHYPMEIHFVHILEGYNASTAQHAPETIAVVAVLLQVAKRGQAFMDLKEAFVSTNITGSKRESVEYTLKPLLPKDTATFFRYEGSLTTPPCTEGVIWTVLVEPNYVSAQQLDFLQNYLSHEGRCLQQNWREIQPLNGRPIYLNKLKSISERMSISSPQINNKSNLSGNFLDGIMFDFPEE
ncbi:hypothetical protein Y032_0811g2467 [Ancylostoma ceylanicum]|uniref:Carbonic anhydrase n=1 Tax=Ancylostoma ceylanicum TaxID=53326 RepID=A0A016WBP7_9BILA|nr:hypothetical protein Y032_0811g2467 [Ancylostoma ceylanicum]